MPAGRSIRIYLATGEVTGIRHAELVNWTGQAVVCPRSRIDELDAWAPEVSRPGVYLLVGAEGPGEREVYFGEAENVAVRVRQHGRSKEFWQEVVLFTSKDENLTKGHVKYLEHRLVQKAKAVGRYKVLNGNEPSENSLPRPDRAAMEEFIENIEVLLGALGHRVFVPLVASPAPSTPGGVRFRYAVRGAEAFGAPSDEGFIVFKGSTGLRRSAESMGVGNVALKQELLASGKLVAEGELVRFVDDVLFGTPSQAGSMVVGTACNGRISWRRVSDGKTLNDLEAGSGPPLSPATDAG
jgi:hypothetical protein